MTDHRTLYEKIRAIAEDQRGDPATRAAAQRKLASFKPAWTPPPNKRHPGLWPSPEHERYTFMDLSNWNRTVNGNRSHVITHKGVTYRVVLFEYKKIPDYGWSRFETVMRDAVFSGRFHTLGEAHRDAWTQLMKL